MERTLAEWFEETQEPLVVTMAKEVLAMYREIGTLRNEVENLKGYKKKWVDSVNASIEHSQSTMYNMLAILTTPGNALDRAKACVKE